MPEMGTGFPSESPTEKSFRWKTWRLFCQKLFVTANSHGNLRWMFFRRTHSHGNYWFPTVSTDAKIMFSSSNGPSACGATAASSQDTPPLLRKSRSGRDITRPVLRFTPN